MKIYSRNFNSGTKVWSVLNRKLNHDVFYTTNYVPSLSTIPFIPAFTVNEVGHSTTITFTFTNAYG